MGMFSLSVMRQAGLAGRRPVLCGIALVFLASSICSADPRSDYAALFGDEEKRVLASSGTRDDVAFASKLLQRAPDLKDAPELQRLVLTRAVEIGQKDPDGLAVAVDAAKLIIAASQGAEKLDWRGKLVDLYAAQYKRATGTKRAEAGEFLLGILQKEADQLLAESKYADAVKRLNEARDIARSIRSPRADEFVAAAKDVQTRQQTAEKFDRLRQKLSQQGGDTVLLEQLILGYLLEVHDATTATTLAASHPDKTWEANLKLASADLLTLPPDKHLQRAIWFRSLAEKSSRASRQSAAEAAFASLGCILAGSKMDATRARAMDELTGVAKLIEPSVSGDRIVIWNEHNTVHNDSGTRTCNVVLMAGGNPVWKLPGVTLDWKQGREAATTLVLPAIKFDAIRIEVVEIIGRCGGLAEVQVIRRGTNLLRGGKATASAMITPAFAPDTLIDGITNSAVSGKGYWVLPDGQTGWAEIAIRP